MLGQSARDDKGPTASGRRRLRIATLAGAAAAGWLAWPPPAAAYIGPGAGFALGGSFLFALIGLLVAVTAVFLWPLRAVLRQLRRRRRDGRATAGRVVVLGLDGLDPDLAERWMESGDLPHLAALRQAGGFRRLATTTPPISPVAWSGFATGVDASRHNIFDFLSRDPATHLPVLSSTRIEPGRRELRLGPWTVRRGRPHYELLRRSKSFWRVLGERGIRSTILRVPITFPPEKFNGLLLSAMCVPDLRGTQGTFTCYSSAPPPAGETIGGARRLLRPDGPGAWRGEVIGPDAPRGRGRGARPGAPAPAARGSGHGAETGSAAANAGDAADAADAAALRLPLRVTVDAAARRADFSVDGQRFSLGPDQDSGWIRLAFRAGPGSRVRGLARFRVLSWAEPFSFYMTPLHVDPESPAVPISHPPHFAMALAKLHGPYATLGLAEDTWALNERVLDEQGFLDQVWAIHAERERQFFHALSRQRDGAVVAVFDATDRIQHMFFRYLDAEHPANRGKESARHAGAIHDLYRRADDLVGRTLARLSPRDVLFVISDHGFKTFQRGVNLNSWFREHGYLRLKGDPDTGPLPPLPGGRAAEPAAIDWPRTRAYANGLAGFYLNLAGRERDGSVPPEAAPALRAEIMGRLRELRDAGRGGAPVVHGIWDAHDVYRGPYRENGPDVVVGWQIGYRAGWDAAVGRVSAAVIEDNTRSWSGDHCIDPELVPGVCFCSRPLADDRPGLVDMAPTILALLGVKPPPYMTGRDLFRGTPTP